MEKTPHLTLAEQLMRLLTGKAVLSDTDLQDCDAYTLGCFDNEIHIDTSGGHHYLLTICQTKDLVEDN